jgi:hypothetical protein
VVVVGVDGEGVPHVLLGPHALLPGRVKSAGSVRDAWCDAAGGVVRRLLGLEQRPLVMLAGDFDGGLFRDAFGNIVRVAACLLFHLKLTGGSFGGSVVSTAADLQSRTFDDDSPQWTWAPFGALDVAPACAAVLLAVAPAARWPAAQASSWAGAGPTRGHAVVVGLDGAAAAALFGGRGAGAGHARGGGWRVLGVLGSRRRQQEAIGACPKKKQKEQTRQKYAARARARFRSAVQKHFHRVVFFAFVLARV